MWGRSAEATMDGVRADWWPIQRWKGRYSWPLNYAGVRGVDLAQWKIHLLLSVPQKPGSRYTTHPSSRSGSRWVELDSNSSVLIPCVWPLMEHILLPFFINLKICKMKIPVLYLVGENPACKWTCESQPRACYSRNNCSKVTSGWGAKGNGKENAFRLVGKYSFLSSLLVSLTDGGSYLVYFWGKVFGSF